MRDTATPDPVRVPGSSASARSRVAIVRCESYHEPLVESAVLRGLELLGGAERFALPDERILLKPNLLVASPRERAVTTHPAVFRAVAKAFQATGACVAYGDSPAFGSAAGVARRSGLAAVAEACGVDLVAFDYGCDVAFAEGKVFKQFCIAEAVLEADGLVSLPRLKTHGLTRVTGAVKNQFGCIPGLRKGEWHACAPSAGLFAQMLVDLSRLLAPRLFVMDAIVAMEGNGPRNGDLRQVGVILISADPVAVDATACRLIGLDPGLLLTVGIGESWGLGTASDIEYLGDPIEEFSVPDFVVDRSPLPPPRGSGRIGTAMRRWTMSRPVVVSERCTSCGMCVTACPVSPRAVVLSEGGFPEYDYDACIRCYCCQELCPERAIEIGTPLLGRFAQRV